MDPPNDEQIDFGDEEYGGSQKMPYHQAGAIPALAEEEMIGEEDEYDDLYNDVNVGEGFIQMQRAEAQLPSSGIGNGGFQASKPNVTGTRIEVMASQEVNKARVANDGNYAPNGVQYADQNLGLPASGGHPQTDDASQRGKLPQMAHNSQAGNFGYPGPVVMPHSADKMNKPEEIVNDPAPLLNQNMGISRSTPQIQANLMNSNLNVSRNRSINDDYHIRPSVDNGNNMLFVGELHWWTTDAELESVLIQYGKVKEIKFFDERASGKSKGYCQVEFYDPGSAESCKEGMDGHIFYGRACAVAFATSQTIKQMSASHNRNQSQSQPQPQGRNPMNDGGGRGNMANYPNGGDGGRNFGRGGWGRGGNQVANRGLGAGPMRGRGGMGNRTMMGNAPAGGGAFGQALGGPGFGGPPGMMHPQGMMGPGFDLAYMGRGAGYGGFYGPSFPGMIPPFQAVNSMGLPGVAPYVNPAFFGHGMTPNGMGMMGPTGMDGPHSGMWTDPNMSGWGGGEENGRGTQESSYGGDDNASEYGGYAEGSHDKGVRSSAASREKERNSEREWSGNVEKRHREEKSQDGGDRYDREQRYREEKDRHRDYRHKDRDVGYDDDLVRGKSSRSRGRSHAVPENNNGSQSRDADYEKRRRMPSE